MSNRGYTLVEILVVLGIIALLFAILFPVYRSVQDKGNASTCLSNGAQIGKATLAYAQDYDEHFPNDAQNGLTIPYQSKKRLWCPALGDVSKVRVAWNPGYAMNGYLADEHVTPSLPSIRLPSLTVMFCEEYPAYSVVATIDPAGPFGDISRDYTYPPGYWAGYTRHSGGSSVVFVDGHAKWYKPNVFIVPPLPDGPRFYTDPRIKEGS